MTPLERFNAWIAGSKVSGMTYKRAAELARGLGQSQIDIDCALAQIGFWLAKNETQKRANKRLWGKFFLNWLKPKSSRQTGRLEPSDFN